MKFIYFVELEEITSKNKEFYLQSILYSKLSKNGRLILTILREKSMSDTTIECLNVVGTACAMQNGISMYVRNFTEFSI